MPAPKFTKVDSFTVASWCPTPDGAGKPEQVHLLIDVAGGQIVVRMKSGRAIDEVVSALMVHRMEVFGEGD